MESLDDLNAASRDAAIELLRPSLDITRWCAAVADWRPYEDVDELVEAAEVAASPFTADEIDGALAQHARIGERAHGRHAEAAVSRVEEAGADTSDAGVAAALAEANRAYEEKFGRVILLRAAGRSASEILEELEHRLARSPEREERIVEEELREIAILRLKGRFTP